MKDYKREIGSKFKTLERDINRGFRGFRKLRTDRPVFSLDSVLRSISKQRKIIALSAVVIAAVAGVVLFAGSFSGKAKAQVSFIGETKAREEFRTMENTQGKGGNEIKTFDTNNNELRFFFYKIKQGESIYAISRKLGVSMDTLISLNNMGDAHTLGEGKRILVPNLQGILYSVKNGDNLESIAKKYKIDVNDILDANDLTDGEITRTDIFEGEMLFLPGAQLTEAERAKALGYLFIKPIHGLFTSGFGIRSDPFTGDPGYHAGIDIHALYGTPVRSAKEGRVIFSGWYGGYGKCVIIKHQFGFETIYGHLSSISVKKDQWVKERQNIGRVGSTGRSTGPHLHFEVRKYGRPVNPIRISGLGKQKNKWY